MISGICPLTITGFKKNWVNMTSQQCTNLADLWDTKPEFCQSEIRLIVVDSAGNAELL
jgi:hypothetical protein